MKKMKLIKKKEPVDESFQSTYLTLVIAAFSVAAQILVFRLTTQSQCLIQLLLGFEQFLLGVLTSLDGGRTSKFRIFQLQIMMS